MFQNIREPGGVLGAFAVGSAVLLLLSGLFAIVVMIRNDQGFDAAVWTIWMAVGLANWVGCVGFALGRRQAVLGGTLAAVGALAFAAFYFWALLPLLLGPAIALLAVLRARRLAPRSGRLATA